MKLQLVAKSWWRGKCVLVLALWGILMCEVLVPCGIMAREIASSGEQVHLNFASRKDLLDLLKQVPLNDFSRESVRPYPGRNAIAIELMISKEEAAALRMAGWDWSPVESPRKGNPNFPESDKDFISYLNNEEIGDLCGRWERSYPDLARRVQWGTSVEGRPLWGLVISDDVQHSEAETEVRLASTMHGDEPVGTVMLLNLAQLLLTSYGQAEQEELTTLVAHREIHILPMLNPDGYAYGIRTNAQAVDLNRDFPAPSGYHPEQAPETLAFMGYSQQQHFAISLNMHTGALVVNYPWDYTFELAPDNEAIIFLSQEYADRNPPMLASEFFPGGITNGATWYSANGTLQDWSYAETGCVDLTVELNGLKKPAVSLLPGLWEDNRESLLQFIRSAEFGLHGIVTDRTNGLPLAAAVTIAGNPQSVWTDPQHGDYSKLLPTGSWQVSVAAAGYDSLVINDVQTIWEQGTRLDVALTPLGWDPAPETESTAISAQGSPGPGPFEITYASGWATGAHLKVFDLRGFLVADFGRVFDQGKILWDGRSTQGSVMPSGSYFFRLESERGTATARVMLVR